MIPHPTTEFNQVIWLNGEFIPWDQAQTHLLTFTLHYGLGCFEGVRAYQTPQGTAIFRLQDHTDRLFNSAHIVRMKIPYTKDVLNAAQQETVRRNGLKSAYLRPLCFYGVGKGLHTKNLPVNVMIAAWEWGAYLGAENLEKGLRIATSSHIRNHVNSVFCKAKVTGNYVNSVMAVQEAQHNGYDEALLLDHQGYIAEGSGENFFIIKKGVLYTPDTAAILQGITRETIMTLASEQGLTVKEKRITRDEAYTADEAFFTGTAAEVTPIREIDGRQIGIGRRGPITTQLQQTYFDLVQDKAQVHTDWLTYV